MPATPPFPRPPNAPGASSGIDLTGVWRCNDGGLYSVRQLGDTVVWAGLHDSGFHRGIEFANVFWGTYGADGLSVLGEWVDVPRGATGSSGVLRFTITRDDVGQVELIRDATETSGGFGGSGWWFDGSLLEPHDVVGITKRVRRYDGWAGDNNPPCRDFTVMSGFATALKGPTLPPDPNDYCSFVTSNGGLFGWGGDGDFTFDLQPDFDLTDEDFWTHGWVSSPPPAFAPEAPVDHIRRSFDNHGQHFHCENAMYGRANSDDDCAETPNVLLPGWNERSGNSVLVNGRPIEGRVTATSAGGGGDLNLRFTFGIGPNGRTVDLAVDQFVRVTGIVADDAGHEGEGAPEIHPVYQIDLWQDFARDRPQTLSGAWHGSDSGTYYIRQLGESIWWLGLSRDQGRSFANVFRGTFSKRAGVIEGEWIDVPIGIGGVLSGGTLSIEAEEGANRIIKAGETAPFGATSWWKLYDTPGVPAGDIGPAEPRAAGRR